MIWLHGSGSDGTEWAGLENKIKFDNFRLILPHAPWQPLTIAGYAQARAWFDVKNPEPKHEISREGYKRSIAWVTKLIEAERKRGIKSDHILLGGHSQGGIIALGAGLRYGQPLLGIVALSAYLPDDLASLPKGQLNTPIFLGWGEADPVITDARVRGTEENLYDQGLYWSQTGTLAGS